MIDDFSTHPALCPYLPKYDRSNLVAGYGREDTLSYHQTLSRMVKSPNVFCYYDALIKSLFKKHSGVITHSIADEVDDPNSTEVIEDNIFLLPDYGVLMNLNATEKKNFLNDCADAIWDCYNAFWFDRMTSFMSKIIMEHPEVRRALPRGYQPIDELENEPYIQKSSITHLPDCFSPYICMSNNTPTHVEFSRSKEMTSFGK